MTLRIVPESSTDATPTEEAPERPVSRHCTTFGELFGDLLWQLDRGQYGPIAGRLREFQAEFAGIPLPPTQTENALYDLVLGRCGFQEDGELHADGAASNDLAHERATAVMAFLELAAQSLPRKLLPKEDGK